MTPLRPLLRFALFLILPVLVSPSPAHAKKQDHPTWTEVEAATEAMVPQVSNARRSEQACKLGKDNVRAALKEHGAIADAIRTRFLEDEDHVTKAEKRFANVFNHLVTVAAFHRVRTRATYICWSRKVGKSRMRALIPASTSWSWKYSKESQLSITVTQNRLRGIVMRTLKVHCYRWDVVYSGVGGENYKKLAESIRDFDVDEVRDVGGKVTKLRVQKLSRAFPRAYAWTATIEDPDLGTLQRREFYIKGRRATFNLALTDYLIELPRDDAVTRWQLEDDDVEMRFLLESLEVIED